MTLIVGVNPSESGPRLWLGFRDISWLGAGVFLQPSELLKPLLVIFLAAYLSRRHALLQLQINGRTWRLPIAFLAPMLVMWGLSMFMVIVQRDLGAGWVIYWGFCALFIWRPDGVDMWP
jgi:cell division protein FtsW (lipid II flippase)